MRQWLAFGSLAAIWGTGFLFTRIGVDELPPATFVLYRLVLGAVAVGLIVVLRRDALGSVIIASPTLAVVGIMNVAGTFTLITWAQQFVPSGVASILVGATPFFATGLAVATNDERLTVPRLAGLSIGFVGLAILFAGQSSGAARPGVGPEAAFTGAVVILGSAAIVAVAAVVVRRRFRHESPIAITMTQLLASIPVTLVLALLVERTPGGLLDVDVGVAGLSATLWMGLLGAGVANVVFYWLIATWGVTRTTLIAYVMPVVGVALGVVVLDEALDLTIVLATALVVFGLILVHVRRRTMPEEPPHARPIEIR